MESVTPTSPGLRTAFEEACSDDTKITPITIWRLPYYSPQQISNSCFEGIQLTKKNFFIFEVNVLILKSFVDRAL
jgi:hypothetical protein